MTPEKTAQLRQVAQALLIREQQGLAGLLAREASMRSSLHKLDDMVQRNRGPAQENPVVQWAGADLLWQAWVTRKRAELQIALAEILARKQPAMDRARCALGRDIAADRIHRRAIEARKKARHNRG